MWDSEDNQKLYPQPSGQKEGCGFPVMRLASSFCLSTGLLLDHRKDSLDVSERALWRQMWGNYEDGDVVLADCGFCSLTDYWMLSERGVDCVMKLHQRREEKKIIKKFNKNDYLVLWEKGSYSQAPDWITREQWEQIPQAITVRHVKVTVDIPGHRTRKFTIATTLLDNEKYPPQALADLYRRRWMAELYLRDLKTTMHMDVLRCKTTDMVHKEITIFFIAYNLIRSLIWRVALSKGGDPYRISFTGTIATLRQWLPILANIGEDKEKRRFIEALSQVIADDIVRIRKIPKQEPRAIKRRMKNYPLLTKPRDQYIEIPHRKKYRKDRHQSNRIQDCPFAPYILIDGKISLKS